jgi:phosphoribosylformylglycinamidine cyclo-ligase
MPRLTYKSSGVDIDKANEFINKIKPLVNSTKRKEVLKQIGGFGGFFQFSKERFKNPVLVSSADGVGTKLKIAILLNKHNTVGIDLVAMNVNDILTSGAEPIFFLDYISTGKLDPQVLVGVIEGITTGCKQAGCALIGGETAQMPGMYKEGDYDLAGFCVGVVEKARIVDGSRIKLGDKVIGLASNGLHSNGFSLVRKIFSENELKRMGDELLEPTRIYVKPVLSLLRLAISDKRLAIKGIAHITGGAFYEKIPRIIPKGMAIRIEKDSWPIPKIFRSIQRRGNIDNREMFRTFNMGIGMVLVVDKRYVKTVKDNLSKLRLKSWVIGEVIKGKKEVEIM